MTIDDEIVAMRAAVEAGYYPLDEYIRFVVENRREGMNVRREAHWSEEVERLEAENERLRATIADLTVANERLRKTLQQHWRSRKTGMSQATIADLKGKSFQQMLEENERLLTNVMNWKRIATEVTAQQVAQRLENEMLRSALQRIDDMYESGSEDDGDGCLDHSMATIASTTLAACRPAYVKPSIREIKFSKRSTEQ